MKETEEISNEKEIQNRLPVNPWTGAIIYGATAPPRSQPRARAPAVNRGAAKPKSSERKLDKTGSKANEKKNGSNTVITENQVMGRVFTNHDQNFLLITLFSPLLPQLYGDKIELW